MPVRILDLTPPDMGILMQKLATNFGGKKDLEQKSDLWYERLQHYPLAIVERVVDRLLSEDSKYFPTLGHAVAIAKELAPDLQRDRESPRAAMRVWEQDPWATIASLDSDRQLCSSAPCPVCGSVIQFTNRGAMIVHDAARHREAGISYSNIGRPEWWEMGYPVSPEPKKTLKPRTPNPYPAEPAPAAPLAEVVQEVAAP